MERKMNVIAISVPLCAVFVLFIAYALSAWIAKAPEGTDRMREIADFIRETAFAFRKREYKMMIPIALVVFLLLALLLDWKTAGLFLLGILLSCAAGSVAAGSAAKGNLRAALLAKEGGFSRAQRIAFRSGAVFGLCAVGFGLLGSGIAFLVFGVKTASVIGGFGFGACLNVLFERIAETIHRKSMPAVLRKGTAIGEAAGMTADLFSSYTAAIIAIIMLSSTAVQIMPSFGNAFLLDPMTGALFPLSLLGVIAIGSALAAIIVRGKGGANPTATLHVGIAFNVVILLAASLILSWIFFEGLNCGLTVILGLLYALAVAQVTSMTSKDGGRNVKRISVFGGAGPVAVIQTVFSAAFFSSLWSVLLLAGVLFLAKAIAGTYGIALAAIGALSVTGMMLSAEGFGLVSDNAGWIARAAGISAEGKTVIEKLEMTGKRVVMSGKGFSTGAVALTLVALVFAYCGLSGLTSVDLMTSRGVIGILFGSTVPFLAVSLLLDSLARVAGNAGDKKDACETESFEEFDLRRAEWKLREKTSSRNALKETANVGLLAIMAPLLTGLLFGTQALAGFLIGVMTTGLLLATATGNAGNLFENVKKYIEADHYGGRGSESHQASMIGERLGCGLKDLVGPSFNALARIMAVEAVLLAPVFQAVNGLF